MSAGRVMRRVLLALGVLGLVVPAVAAADPGHLGVRAQLGLYEGSCAAATDYPPVHEDMFVCVWDAMADPDTLPVTGGPERTVDVQYSHFLCDPTCTNTTGRAQVPARDVTFDPGMTGVHVHTDVNGCHVDLDESGLAQTPSTPVGLLDLPYVRGPGHWGGHTILQASDGGSNGLWQYYKNVDISVCGHAGSTAGGFDTDGWGTLDLVATASLDGDVPDGADSMCADATVLWYWHATAQSVCLPPS